MKTKETMKCALVLCLSGAAAGCVQTGPELEDELGIAEQRVDVPADVIQQLNDVGTEHTGITYSIPPPMGDISPPLVLTSQPVEGLVRRYKFPGIADAFDVAVTVLPPGPILPPSPVVPPTLVTRVFAAGDGSSPIGVLQIPPPVNDRGPILKSKLATEGFLTVAELELPDAELGTAGSLAIESGFPGSAPLVSVKTQPPPVSDQPPPVPDFAKFKVKGSNFTIVGLANGSQIAFEVRDASNKVVATYGGPMGQ